MKEIKLTQGKVALVDDCDFEYLSQYNWFAIKNYNTYYACRNERIAKGRGGQRLVWMHRVILGVQDKEFVDHIDRNGLNNTRCNLRKATISQNSQNRRLKKTNTSGITGISWDKSRERWQVNLMVDGVNKKIGRFKSKKEAIQARRETEKQYHPFSTNVNNGY